MDGEIGTGRMKEGGGRREGRSRYENVWDWMDGRGDIRQRKNNKKEKKKKKKIKWK